VVPLCGVLVYVQLPELALVQPQPFFPMYTLKIEEDGDPRKGAKPKIRLIGRWLERAGFKPGGRITVVCLAPGHIELRSLASHAADTHGLAPDEASNCPF